MKLSISTCFYHDRSITPGLELLAKGGIRCIEIDACDKPHFDYNDKRQVRALSERLQELGIQPRVIHAPFGKDCDLSVLDDEKRRRAVAEVKKVAAFFSHFQGSEIVVVHPSDNLGNDNKELRFEKCLDSLRSVLSFCNDRGLRVAVENMPADYLCSTASELAELLRAVNSTGLGVCLDTGHAFLQGDLLEVLQVADQRLITLHVQDNLGEKDDHLIPFEGKIEWDAFMHTLFDIKYDDVFSLELNPREESVEATVTKVQAVFERLMDFYTG